MRQGLKPGTTVLSPLVAVVTTRHTARAMKSRLVALICLLIAHTTFAADLFFYIGTYSGPKSKGVYRCSLDSDTRKLGPVELIAEASSPSFLALSPDGRFVYSVQEAGKGTVAAWSFGND